jgi:ribosomal 50S subunit-recycling heat shock protein
MRPSVMTLNLYRSTNGCGTHVYKTRALAQTIAAKGRIRVNGWRIKKLGTRMRTGDIMTLAPARRIMVIRVLERLGPAEMAQLSTISLRALDRGRRSS